MTYYEAPPEGWDPVPGRPGWYVPPGTPTEPFEPPARPPPTPALPSWDSIISALKSWLEAAIKAWNWVKNAFWNVWEVINTWWETKRSEVLGIVNAALGGVVEAAINAWNWVKNAWWNTWDIIDNWWSVKQWDVKALISSAVEWLENIGQTFNNFWTNLWPALVAEFNNLKSAWGNFWSVTLPRLVSFDQLESWWQSRVKDVQGLLNTTTRELARLSEGWLDMRQQVVTFFADPVEFIWQRFTEWFLGAEE